MQEARTSQEAGPCTNAIKNGPLSRGLSRTFLRLTRGQQAWFSSLPACRPQVKRKTIRYCKELDPWFLMFTRFLAMVSIGAVTIRPVFATFTVVLFVAMF
jgi:hypothetical protein